MKIQNLFFPDRIGTYYLFPTKIVGLHITAQAVYATVITTKNRTLTITGSFTQRLSQEKGGTHEHITAGLQALFESIGSYDSVVCTLPSSYSLFKELRLPFIAKEKISLILPHEIEPYLPFPLHEAAFDCALVNSDLEKGFSDVIVAATQRKYIKELVDQYHTAHITPDAITVDILALYGMYRSAAHLYPLQEQAALVAFDDATIHIVYLHDGILKTVRSLSKDMHNETKNWQSLIFTLQSFSQEYGTLQTVLCLGTTQSIIVEKLEKDLGISCQLFEVSKSLPALSLQITDTVKIESLNVISLSAAYPSVFTTHFSLATEESMAKEQALFKKQAIVTGILTALFLGAMLTHTILQVHALSKAIDDVKTSTVKELRKSFPMIKSNNLNEALKVAKNAVNKEEEIWFSFSNQTRRSFLKYLYQLSTKIERDVVGLNLRKLVFNKDTILLEGSVRSFDAVNQLEQELKDTKLFVHVPDFQKTDFSQLLTLNAQGDIA